MNLEAFVLGSGGMMPLPHRALTSVLLRREGELFLFDGGEGTQVSIRRLNLRWKKITAIFVSHMHADHVTGSGLLRDHFGAKTVDLTETSMIVMVTGNSDKVDACVDMLKKFGIIELVRTGKVLMDRRDREN